MRAAFQGQQRLQIGDSHRPTPNRRQPRSTRVLHREINEQIREKKLQLDRLREKWSVYANYARKHRSSIRKLERQIQHYHVRLTLLRSGRFLLVLGLPFWIGLRISREQLWRHRKELDELLDEQQTLAAVIRRLEDECRDLEVRRVLLQAQLRRQPHRASTDTGRNSSRRRQRPHHP